MRKAFKQGTDAEVCIGDTVTSFRGETGKLEYLSRAKTPGKSGKVVVNGWESYDNVWGLEVRDVEPAAVKAYLKPTGRELSIGDTLMSDLGQIGTLETIGDTMIKVDGVWRDPAWWGVRIQSGPTAQELMSALVRYYATCRRAREGAPASSMLIHAWTLVYGVSHEEADEQVADLLEDIYANMG